MSHETDLPADVKLKVDNLLKDEWYYRIQLGADQWTTAQRFTSVGITRALLQRADLRFGGGVSLLDIGTMEAMVPIVAMSAGAGRVVAYDRLVDRKERVEVVKSVYGYDFDHITGMPLDKFRESHNEQYDVVVFSGVFYHMFDPFAGLGLAASFAKPGGLVIFETAAISKEDCALHFNKAARYNPGTCFFMPTPDALDNFLRFYGLAAIDMHYILGRVLPEPLIRIALTCRVIGAPLPLAGDGWMKRQFGLDLSEVHLDRSVARSDPSKDVPYEAPDWSRVTYREVPAINVSKALATSKPWPVDPEMTELSFKYRKAA